MVRYLASRRGRFLIAFSLFLILPHLAVSNAFCAVSRHEADEGIQEAEAAVSSAFEVALEAENAGADVSGFAKKLNEAGALLTEAKILLRNGDFEDASELADRSLEIANDVKEGSLSHRSSALSQRNLESKVATISSLVGVPLFLFLMFCLWRWFKRVYTRKFLGMKPEVGSDAEA